MNESKREGDPGADVAPAAHQQIIRSRVDDAQRNRRLDDPGRRRDDVERGEGQGDAVRDGERRHHERQLTDGPAQQEQADEEQQVVGSDQDVMHTRGDEALHDRPDALPAAGEILELDPARVEDGLRQRGAFVDVQERLMVRVVREHHRRHGDGSRRAVERVPEVQPDRLAIFHHLGVRPFRPQRAAVGRHQQPRRQEVDHRALTLRHERRVEQTLGRVDVQIVGDVEHVRDERAVNRA